jgi:hypothetical protein
MKPLNKSRQKGKRMAYKIIIEKRIIKILSEIDEPYHSLIEKAIY